MTYLSEAAGNRRRARAHLVRRATPAQESFEDFEIRARRLARHIRGRCIQVIKDPAGAPSTKKSAGPDSGLVITVTPENLAKAEAAWNVTTNRRSA